jgi:hypothetical protein
MGCTVNPLSQNLKRATRALRRLSCARTGESAFSGAAHHANEAGAMKAALMTAAVLRGLGGGARWIRTAGPGCSIGSGQFLPVSVSPSRSTARLRRTGEGLASDPDRSDVYVCPKKEMDCLLMPARQSRELKTWRTNSPSSAGSTPPSLGSAGGCSTAPKRLATGMASPNLPRGWRRPRTPNVAADRARHARGDCFPPTAGPATYGCTRAMAVPQIEPKKMSGVAAYSPATHTLLSLGSTPAPE